jgi:hypothetical protein
MLRNPSRLVAHWFPRYVYICDATGCASAHMRVQRGRRRTEREARAEEVAHEHDAGAARSSAAGRVRVPRARDTHSAEAE